MPPTAPVRQNTKKKRKKNNKNKNHHIQAYSIFVSVFVVLIFIGLQTDFCVCAYVCVEVEAGAKWLRVSGSSVHTLVLVARLMWLGCSCTAVYAMQFAAKWSVRFIHMYVYACIIHKATESTYTYVFVCL